MDWRMIPKHRSTQRVPCLFVVNGDKMLRQPRRAFPESLAATSPRRGVARNRDGFAGLEGQRCGDAVHAQHGLDAVAGTDDGPDNLAGLPLDIDGEVAACA